MNGGIYNLPGVSTIRNVAHQMTNLCTTGLHPCTHLLERLMIRKPLCPVPRLQRIEGQLRASSLTPQEAYKELLPAGTALLPTPDMVVIAAEAAIRKLTWRLPFIFDTPLLSTFPSGYVELGVTVQYI